jgi:hypothetical protein
MFENNTAKITLTLTLLITNKYFHATSADQDQPGNIHTI